MIPMTDERERPDVINNGNNITCISTSTIGSLCVSEVTEIRESGKQNVEFSPRFTKSQNNGSKDLRDNSVIEEPPLQDLSERMLTLYLQHLGNSVYLMLIMALGFVYPLINALSYGTEKYEKSKEQFEIFMIIIHGISIIVLSLVLIRLTLRKSDEDRGHGEGLNFFLRIGAIVFCIGVIILNILRALEPIELQLIFKCHVPVRPTHVFYYSLSVIFYALQTYFMFKYHKTSFLSGPNRHERYVINIWIIRYILIHLTAVNLIHWVNAIMWEAVEVFEEAYHTYNNTIELTVSRNKTRNCYGITTAKGSTPFLFPCVIEYSLIVAGIFITMYRGVDAFENTLALQTQTQRATKGYSVLLEMFSGTHSSSIRSRPSVSSVIADSYTTSSLFIPPRESFLPSRRSIHVGRQSVSFLPTFVSMTKEIERRTSVYIERYEVEDSNVLSSCEKIIEESAWKHIVSYIFTVFLSVGGVIFIISKFMIQKLTHLSKHDETAFRIVWLIPYMIGTFLAIQLIKTMFYKFKYEYRLKHDMETMLLYVNFLGNLVFLLLCLVCDVDNLVYDRYYEKSLQILNIIYIVTQIIQETAQCIFLFCGENLQAKEIEQKQTKNGRDALSILIALNIIIWLRESMLFKSFILSKQYIQFFGLTPWCIMACIFLPLIVFYRFQSASIFATVWTHAYL